MNSNVVYLDKYLKEARETNQFLDLINQDIKQGNRVKPLSASLNSRIAALKAKAEKARAETELLEG